MSWRRALRGVLRRHTVGDVLELYHHTIEGRQYKPKTHATYRVAIGHISHQFGSQRLVALQAWQIAAWLKSVADSGRRNTARALLGVMRDVLNEAIQLGWLDANPALHVRPTKAPVQRQRMTLEQWHAIMAAGRQCLPVWWPHAWQLAIVSGQRCADLVAMRYDHIQDGWLYIELQKTGARIALPLALRLEVLDLSLGQVIEASRHYGEPGTHVIRSPRGWRPLSPKTLTHQVMAARKAADITVQRGTPPALHEVRSLAERLYRAQGVDTKTLLGHKRQSMTDVYNDERGLHGDAYKRLLL